MRSWWPAFFLVACTGGGDPADTDEPDNGDDEITLETCGESMGGSVPDFFANYFRCSDIEVQGDSVVISTDDLPPHRSYYYGEDHANYEAFDTSRGSEYHPNPNELAEQDLTFTIPLDPTSKGITITAGMVDLQMGTDANELDGGPVGVAIDGVALFNSQAAPGDDINDEKYTFDSYEAHPAGETYHYHTATPGPLEVMVDLGLSTSSTPGAADIELYGIMCDGTVVLGCTELDGSVPSTGDFDAQNGHVHDLVDDQGATLLTGRYHTHVCVDSFTGHTFTPEIQYYTSCERTGAGP